MIIKKTSIIFFSIIICTGLVMSYRDNLQLLFYKIDSSLSITKLAKYKGYYVSFSPDGTKVAYTAIDKGMEEGKKVTSIFKMIAGVLTTNVYAFTPAPPRYQYIIVNGRRASRTYGTAEARASITLPTFSRDSKHLMYTVSEGAKKLLVIDEQEYPMDVSDAIFHPDNVRIVYITRSDTGYRVVIDDLRGKKIEGKNYPFINKLSFSPNGNILTYTACEKSGNPLNNHCKMIQEENEGPVFEDIGGTSWSSDSQHFAYVGEDGDPISTGDTLVVDGAPRAIHQLIWDPTFSSDGKSLAYGAKDGQKISLVLNDTTQLTEELGFRHDGSRYTYEPQVNHIAFSKNDRLAYALSIGNPTSWYAVIDGAKQPIYDRVTDILWSPSGNKTAYIAGTEAPGVDSIEYERVLVNGKIGKRFDTIFPGTLSFTPNEEHVQFAARIGDRIIWVKEQI